MGDICSDFYVRSKKVGLADGMAWEKENPPPVDIRDKYRVSTREPLPCEEVPGGYKGSTLPDFNPQDNRAYGPTTQKKVPSSGGPSSYYDMPFQDWVTVNDMAEHLAEHKWGKYGIHLKDIFKGLCRWGEKEGTDTVYDAKKIIYYGLRVLRMLVGVEKTRDYLNELLNDKQFGGDK